MNEGDADAGSQAQQGQAEFDAGRLGMTLFLLSLSMLFLASMVGYLVVRFRAETWPPEGMPSLPGGLWISTAILLAASGAVHWAYTAARAGRLQPLKQALTLTTLLGTSFLVAQYFNWSTLVAAGMPVNVNLFSFLFYFLTGLHAAHVVGGVILLLVVTQRAFAGRYTAESHRGVWYSAVYWHFLDIVWVVMFAVILLA